MPCIIKPESTRGFACNTLRPNSFLLLLLFVAVDQVNCLTFTYPEFNNSVWSDFELNGGSNVTQCALQATTEITRRTKPGSEGLAYTLTKGLYGIHPSSYGDQWLGVVNETANGSSSISIMEADFDNKKRLLEGSEGNHVGIHFNSMYWECPRSLINYNRSEKKLERSYYREFNFGLAFSFSLDTLSRSSNRKCKPRRGLKVLPDPVIDWTTPYTKSGSLMSLNFTSTNTVYATPTWVWVVLPITITIMIFMIVINIYWRIKKARDRDQERGHRDQDQESESSPEHEIEISMIGPKKYKLDELKTATGNFNAHNEIGRGGFGIVYRGTLGGEVIAVKRTSRNDQQGRKNMIAEVASIGSLHHKNLLKLFGWCYESNELLLVYEYMPNGSLDNLLFPEDVRNQATLSWERRYNIVCGVAQSIDYLHNECSRRVLHRDIKTSNVMLDSEFNACLGDFGLARMFKLSEKTHHTTIEIAGTRAYMAPEIFFTGKATTQADVYAFGVLALEVACGRRPGMQTVNGEEMGYSIVDWVWEIYKLGMIYSAVDPKLNESYDKEQAECVLLIGLACCHPDPQMRPSMRSTLQVLMGETERFSVPMEKPAFVWPSPAPPLSMELDDHSISGEIDPELT